MDSRELKRFKGIKRDFKGLKEILRDLKEF